MSGTPSARSHARTRLKKAIMSDFDVVLERLVCEPAFRAALAADPARALTGYALSPGEVELLHAQLGADTATDSRVEQRTSKAGLFGLAGALGGVGHLAGGADPTGTGGVGGPSHEAVGTAPATGAVSGALAAHHGLGGADGPTVGQPTIGPPTGGHGGTGGGLGGTVYRSTGLGPRLAPGQGLHLPEPGQEGPTDVDGAPRPGRPGGPPVAGTASLADAVRRISDQAAHNVSDQAAQDPDAGSVRRVEQG
jgi:hypothetical protein